MKKFTNVQVAVIAAAGSLSAALDLGGGRAVRLATPATLAGTVFTFQTAPAADGTFSNLYKADGTEYTVQMGTSRAINLDLVDFLGIQHLKIRSGTAAAPSVQGGAAVNITVIAAPQ